MLGLVFSFFLETVDSSLRTIEGVETYLGVPVLGVIPEVDRREFKEKYAPVKDLPDDDPLLETYITLSAHFAPKSPVAEAYRLLRTNLKFLGMEKMGKSFIITSSTLREGKTTNVINLALTMAQAGMKTLIVESDLRKPSIYSVFGLYKEPGLTDILLGNYTWEEVVKGITDLMVGKLEMGDLMKTPGIDNLYIITCGSIPPNPSELLSSPKMSKFITEIEQKFDLVLFDTPPILPVADAAILSQLIDGTLLIYEVGRVSRQVLKRAKTQIDNVKGSVWGVILNNVKTGISPDYYKYNLNLYHVTEGKKSYILLFQVRNLLEKYLSKFFIPLLPHRLRLLILLSVLLILTVILWQMNYLQGSKNKIPLAQKWLRGVFKEEKKDLPYPKTIIPKSEIEESKGEETIDQSNDEPLNAPQDFTPITYYPYSILISSNQEEKYALTDWRVLHSQGYSAYINLTNVKGKGEFYRVFVGIFEREDEARECAKKIKGPFTSSVLSTPYSLEIGVFSSRDTADQEMENLQKKGYFPYLVPIQEGQEFRVLLGAFTRSEEFVSLSQQLMAEGITYQVVRR
jgi:capsular exopolysaccharide synthesis family protein